MGIIAELHRRRIETRTHEGGIRYLPPSDWLQEQDEATRKALADVGGPHEIVNADAIGLRVLRADFSKAYAMHQKRIPRSSSRAIRLVTRVEPNGPRPTLAERRPRQGAVHEAVEQAPSTQDQVTAIGAMTGGLSAKLDMGGALHKRSAGSGI